jgi:hypothetical protein
MNEQTFISQVKNGLLLDGTQSKLVRLFNDYLNDRYNTTLNDALSSDYADHFIRIAGNWYRANA